MISKLLIANRGEIAVRVIRTCRDLGVAPVAIHSDVDAASLHVKLADASVRLSGARAAETYLNGSAIIDAALNMGADAIHPGYGFLAENAGFANAVIESGLTWVGPSPKVIAALGDKVAARRIASSAGVPVVPGLFDPVSSADAVLSFGSEHGYPLVVKAASGGGGRGLKIVQAPEDAHDAFISARREASAYFGSDDVYLERYLARAKHLEVQILGLSKDEALWLGVRDCSMQRRHQKLVEETPPPKWEERADDMGAAATRLARAAGYINAGTVELLVDEGGDFYFLEVNSRLQVEHTVTEEIFGLDLVACQLKIASQEDTSLTQGKLKAWGHSIECRINAEDPNDFLPAPGRLIRFDMPSGPGVRVDSGYAAGDTVPGDYDSLIAKVITWGVDRDHARRRMKRALREFVIEGVPTSVSVQLRLIEDSDFRRGQHTTQTVEARLGFSGDRLPLIPGMAGPAVRSRLWNPAMAAAAPSASNDGAGELVAPLQATILEVRVASGDRIEAGDVLVVLEAMKMETVVSAPFAGKAREVRAIEGKAVGAGDVLVIIEQHA